MKQAMKKGLTVVMVLVMAAALLTGCGKDGGSGDQGFFAGFYVCQHLDHFLCLWSIKL